MGCAGLVELREAMAAFAGAFDPALISADDASKVVDEAARIEKMAATVKGLAAARVADTGLWRIGGAKSAAHDLAQRSGSTVGAASEVIDSAKKMADLAVLAGAARRGEVSAQQASAIADAATADPTAETRLVAKAKRSSLGELREECSRTRAAARPADEEARHAEVRRTRYLRSFCDREGGWNLSVRNVADVGAQLLAVLRPVQDRLFRQARAEGRRESYEAYAADALAELVRMASGSSGEAGEAGDGEADGDAAGGAGHRRRRRGRGVPAKILVRIDWDALVRGWPIEGEVCEIAGVGSVPVSVVKAMLGSGDALLAAVVTKGVDVVNVAHLGRRATAHQVSGLQWRDPACPAEGCTRIDGLEIDHREDWAKTRITLLGQLDRPCGHHHYLKTNLGWAFVEGTGKRPMVPPEDPRHPKYRRPPDAGGESPVERAGDAGGGSAPERAEHRDEPLPELDEHAGAGPRAEPWSGEPAPGRVEHAGAGPPEAA